MVVKTTKTSGPMIVMIVEEEVVLKLDDVSLVDGVFDGAFGGEGEEDVVMGEGVMVTSSSLEMLTNSCLGEIMVSLIFLEGLKRKLECKPWK
ncbi:hypothetical protein Tco_0112043 [Tanacetum coccineum]